MAFSSDFAQWKWDLVGLVGAFALAAAQKAWRSYQQRRSETWPVSYGQILVASVEEKNKKNVLTLDYNYRVNSEVQSGSFKKIFDDPDEAPAWADALAHKQVAVHYDPERPSRSQLREADLQPMVRAAAPFRATTLEDAGDLPGWQRVLVSLGFVLALAGLVGIILVLAEGIVGKPLLPPGAASILNTGAFVVFAFAALVAWRGGKQHARAAPEWMKYLEYALFYYAIFSVTFIPPHTARNDHRPGMPAHQETDHRDTRYQLFLYFAALEWCYTRLHAGRHDDDLQRSLQGGVRFGE